MLDISNTSKFECETLGLDFSFKTYADAKLAGLLFDDGFSIEVMMKIFHVVLDPKFSLQDITFKGVGDIFKYVSVSRGKNAEVRERDARPPATSDGCGAHIVAMTSNSIPPVALDLVVDCMLKDSVPLGVVAEVLFWKDAYADNGVDFRNMSLVHRSWTTIAQGALRRRAIVPYYSIHRFLLSPLCGPWVKEMVVYWTVDDGDRIVSKDDILLLEALLERTPNVRSLSFNTSLVCSCDDYSWDDDQDEPPVNVDNCLDIMSTRLPSLEHLWLKHFVRRAVFKDRPVWKDELQVEDYPTKKSVLYCKKLHRLCTYMPQFRSLQHLSVQGWSSPEPEQEEVFLDWTAHPPSHLKSIEVDFSSRYGLSQPDRECLVWLLKPRDGYQLRSFSIRVPYYAISHLGESLKECLSETLDDHPYIIDEHEHGDFRWLTYDFPM